MGKGGKENGGEWNTWVGCTLVFVWKYASFHILCYLHFVRNLTWFFCFYIMVS